MGSFLKQGMIAFTLLLWACDGDPYADIRGHLHVVLHRDDALVSTAMAGLIKHQSRALPQIETALHEGRPQARRRLVEVMARVPHQQTTLLIRHLALYDNDDSVREDARRTLQSWANASDTSVRAAAAQSLQWLQVKQQQGLGPVVHSL